MRLTLTLSLSILMCLHFSAHGLFKGITETVEKTTKGAAQAVEDVTEAVVPPAKKIVEAPLTVAEKTTTGIANVFRDEALQIANNSDAPLTLEMINSHNKIYSIISMRPGERITVEKPHALILSSGEATAKIKPIRGKQMALDVSLKNGDLRIKKKQGRKVVTERSPKQMNRKIR